MFKLCELYANNPKYQPDKQLVDKIRSIKDFKLRMNEALGCAEILAVKGSHVAMYGDVRSDLINQALLFKSKPAKIPGIEFQLISAPSCHSVRDLPSLYLEMKHIIGRMQEQIARLTHAGRPYQVRFVLDDLGFEVKNIQQLDEVIAWLNARIRPKPEPKPASTPLPFPELYPVICEKLDRSLKTFKIR